MSNSQNSQENTTNQSNESSVRKQRSSSFHVFSMQQKIIQQSWKIPSKQVSILLNDNDASIQQIMDRTNCKITINNTTTDHSDHKMIQITLEGTSDQIFNGHKEINYIRQNGHLMSDKDRKKARFGDHSFRNRHRPKKLSNWNLNVEDSSMLNIVNAILSKSDPTNWAIFKFDDNNEHIDNLKVLSIDKYGDGGVNNLASNLSNIKELKYCLLRFDYGFDIERHQIILIMWSPSTARNGQKRNIIPILRHKSLIKQTLCATHEITVSIHSYLTPSFILSELHSKNLVPEILLRVIKRTNNINNIYDDDDENMDENKENMMIPPPSLPTALSTPSVLNNNNINNKLSVFPKPGSIIQQKTTPNLQYVKTDKFFASKQWTLSRLKQELSKKYDINESDIQITHILHSVKTRSSKFNEPRQTEHIFNIIEDADKTLSELKLYHGSRIYISSISQDQHKNGKTHKRRLSNRYLAAQRTLQFTKTKTMSKTKKIKIKLTLSTHIKNLKSLKSLKSQQKTEINQQKSKENISLRIARYEFNLNNNNNKQRIKSKSMVYDKRPIQEKQKRQQSEPNKTNIDDTNIDDTNIDDIGGDEITSCSTTHIMHYRQPSVSDNEIDHEMNEIDEMNEIVTKSHTLPTNMHLTRTRSLSTTLTEGLSQKIMQSVVDPEIFQEYTKPQIFEPVVVKYEEKTEEEEKKEDINKPNLTMSRTSNASTTIFEDEENILPLPSSSTSSLTNYSSSDLATETIECTLDLNEVFIVERSVGRGKTAHVHYALYRDECDIALKEFRFGRLTDKILYGFHRELETLKKLDHDNICRLLGHYVDEKSKQLYLAFEWLPCGCLYDVIHDENVAIEFLDVLEMSIDIARGMKYLHSQQIMHRDLKSHNLLLDEAYRVKITDFGTAKTLEKISGTTYTEVGTGGYCAPEVIEPPLIGYDRKVDVFSFGVLMWEIYERKNVFDQRCLRNINQLKQGIRPKISKQCPQEFKTLINECWQIDPKKRPDFNQCVQRLLTIYSQYK